MYKSHIKGLVCTVYKKLSIFNGRRRIDPAITLLGIFPREIKTFVHAALLKINQNWK